METATQPHTLLPADLTARLRRLRLAARTRRAGTTHGDRRSTKRGSSLEFADYRSYAPGDDPRRVDWNQYARTERLFTKVYEEEEDLRVHLLLDASRSMGFGFPSKLRASAALAAALGYVALNEMDHLYAAALRGKSAEGMRALRATRSTTALASWLSLQVPGGETELNAALQAYAGRNHQAGLAVILSDLLDPHGAETGLLALRSRGYDVVVIHMLCRDDVEPIVEGELELVDSETGATFSVSADAAVLEAYRRRAKRWLEEQRRMCRSLGIPYVAASSEEPVEDLLFRRLRALKVLV